MTSNEIDISVETVPMIPPLVSVERNAVFWSCAFTALCSGIVGLLPGQTLVEVAASLSKDGELAPATIRLVEYFSTMALPIALCLGAILVFRAKLGVLWGDVVDRLERIPVPLFLGTVLGGAALIRLLWVLLVPSLPFSDYAEYHGLAVRMIELGAYVTPDGTPTAYRPPGYPVYLAALYSIFGQTYWIPKLLNIVWGTGTVYLIYRLTRSISGEAVARLTTILVAMFPSQIGYTSLLCTEIPATFLLFLFLVLLEEYFPVNFSRRNIMLSLGMGLILAVCSLMRPNFALLPLALFPIAWKRAGFKRAFFVYALIGIGAALLVFPWGIRNAQALGAFTPLSTNGGVNFYHGHNAITNGTGLEMLDPAVDVTSSIEDEIERSRMGFHLGWKYIRENPERIPILYVRKIVMMMITDTRWTSWAFNELEHPIPAVLPSFARLATHAFYYPVLFLAIAELLIFRWRRAARKPVSVYLEALTIYTLVITMLFMGQQRYHFHLVPVLCYYATLFVVRLRGGIKS